MAVVVNGSCIEGVICDCAVASTTMVLLLLMLTVVIVVIVVVVVDIMEWMLWLFAPLSHSAIDVNVTALSLSLLHRSC